MPTLLKIFGMALLFFASTAAGFSASFRLKKQIKTLEMLVETAEKVELKIMLTGAEISRIYNQVLSEKNEFSYQNGTIIFNSPVLEGEDILAVNEFLEGLGSAGTEGEKARCRRYENYLKSRLAATEEKYKSQSKVMKTAGVCIGAAIVIMLI